MDLKNVPLAMGAFSTTENPVLIKNKNTKITTRA